MDSTILVVDDEQDVREFVATVLEAAGYRVLTARDGAEALQQLDTVVPDAILLDISMPLVDGWTALERIKSHTSTAVAEIPVVMLTALGTTNDKLRGGIDGALHYVTKPFEITELLSVLTDVLAPDASPEPVRRRAVQQTALAQVARYERGVAAASISAPTVHLTRLESTAPVASPPVRRGVEARQRLALLSGSQLSLLEALAASDSVTVAADQLNVSRSNIYASLRRICRRLNVRGAAELLDMVRSGELLG